MPKNVSVDGLGDFEFPDEATDGQIKVYLRKQAGLTPHGDKTQRAPKPEPPPPAIAIHKETGVGLVDPGRFDPTKGWGHPDRNGARIAPTYAATADVVAKAPDSTEYVKPSDIPPGYRQSQSQLFTNTRNQLAKSRAEAGGATLASTRTPDQIQAVPDDLPAPLSVMEKRIASAGPAVTGTLDVINERNPMKYWGASAEKFAAPFRVSQDSGAEPPGLSDVLNVLGVGAVSNALTAGGAGRDIDKTGAAQILDPGLAEMTGGVNSIMSGPREFLAPGEGESKAKAAAMLVPRLAGAGVDTFIDPTNMVMMGAGKFGKTAPVRALADTYFAGLMGEGAAQAAGHVAERGAEDGATGVMQALPELAVPAVFGGHAALRGAKAVSGVVEGARQSSAAKKTSAALESATASATEKAAANIANGAGLFDNMTAQEIHAYGLKRRAEATGQPLARDNATDELASIAKTVYGDRPDLNVNIHENASSVKPGLLPEDAAVAAQIPALFDGDKTVGLVRDRINDPLQAVENAKHEKTHGTVEMEPGKIAGVAEDAMKAELVKLVEEKRLAPEEAERLAGLTGPEFVSAVKESAKSNPAMRNASDEVIALLGQQFAAEPGRISQLMGEAARVIPGVTMTPSDVRASMAAQARKKAQPFQPDRPVEMLGEAPQLPPVDRAPAPPVEAAPVVAPPFDMTKVSEDIALDRPTSVGFYGFIPAGLIGERPGEIGMVAAVDAAGRPTEIRHQKTGRVVLRDGKPVSVAEYTGTAPAAPVAEAPVAPKESFVGREVTVGGKKAKIIADDGSGKFVIQPEKGEPRIWTPNKTSHPSVPQKGERVALPDGTEGVIYSADKTSAAIRFDDGTNKIVPREGLRRVEQTVPPEAPVPQPVEQAAPVQQAEAPLVPSEAPPVNDAAARGKVARALAQPNRDMRRRQLELAMEQPTPEPAPAVDPMELFLQKRTAAVVIPKGEPMPRIAGARFIDVDGKRVVYWPGNPSEKKPFQTNRDLLQQPGGLERALEPKIPAQVTDKQRAQLEAMVDEGASMAEVQAALDRVRSPNPLPEVPVAQPVQQVAPVQLAEAPEHRANIATRKAIDEMTPDEARYAVEALRQERHTDEQTGLKNYKAWLEDPIDAETPVKVITDADNFKAYNTNFGHAGGDVVIKDALAEGFRRAGLGDNAYRISRSGGGDEFAFKFKTREEAVAKMEHAREVVRGMRITLEKDGVTRVHEGVEFSHGIGERLDLKDADADLVRNKEQRAADGVRATGRDALPPGFREVRDDLGSTGGRVEGEVGGVPGPDATGPVDPAAASQSPALYSRAPSKHDQLVRPIMGDLVEVASQLMADKANKIRTPEDLVDAMSQHVGAVLAGGIAKEAKTIFAEASKNPEARDKSLTSVKKAMESGLAPAKKLSISNDEAASRLQLAVDRAREDGHIIDVKKDSQTLREGAQLYANIGRDGVINIVMERAKQFGGKLSDGEIVAAKIAMDDGVAHKEAASDPAVYLRQLAFANAFRITATEAGRGLRMYRWDINDPTDVRVKREIHDIFTAALEKNPEKLTLDDATKQLKKIRTFLEKNVGVPDVESIPTAVLTDQAKMVDLVREWSAANATMGMKARTWCMNSLVSAFKTHAANVGGSAGNLAVEYTLHRQLEARLNQLFKVDGVVPSDLAGLTSQMMKVQSMALRDAANYAKTGKNELEQKVYGSDWVGQLRKQKRSFSAKSKLTQEPIEWAGDKLQYVGRALGTEDAYFVSVSGHVEALAAARMHARRVMRDRTGSEGVGTKEYNDIVDREFSDYTSDSWRRGMNRSEYLAFKNETAEGLKTLLSIRRKHPWLTPLAWFLTTPWNLISRGAEFAPGIGLINRGVFRGGNDFSPGDPMYGESKAEIRTRAAAAQIIGLAATAAIAATKASMFNDDGDEPFITGSDPPMSFEKGEKEARRRSLQPYTVKNFLNIFDPNERISYRRLDPMATGLGLTVDIVDMFQDYAHTGSLDRLASKAKSATVGQFVDKPFLQGPSDVIRMFQDGPSKKSPIEYALGLLGNFYPRFFQQFPAALDDKVRETKNYGATKQQEGQSEVGRMLKTAAYRATGFPSLPFVGQLAEPKVNLGGEEVGKTGSPLYRLTVPADRYGDEGISPEARRLDLNYIQSVPHLAEDAPNYPTESGPSLSFGGKNFKMFPQDWAEAEKQRGAMFMDLAKKAGFTEKRSKPFSPEELKALGAFAQAGSGVAKAKMIPRYWSPNK